MNCIVPGCPHPAEPGKLYCREHQALIIGPPIPSYGGGADPPIVLTGGSVVISFDESLFPRQPDGRFRNADKKITRVEIFGDYDPATGQVRNGDVTIIVHYATP